MVITSEWFEPEKGNCWEDKDEDGGGGEAGAGVALVAVAHAVEDHHLHIRLILHYILLLLNQPDVNTVLSDTFSTDSWSSQQISNIIIIR